LNLQAVVLVFGRAPAAKRLMREIGGRFAIGFVE
jgi:hypothetical protein